MSEETKTKDEQPKLRAKDLKDNNILTAKFFWEFHNKLPIVQANRHLYQYNGKHYELIDHFGIRQRFYEFASKGGFSSLFSSNRATEMYNTLLASPYIKETEFDTYRNMICLRNGIIKFDTTGITRYDHHEGLHFSTMIDADYEPNLGQKDCPRFMEFLRHCFTDENDVVDEETVQQLLEIGGYLLYPQNKLRKMFIFLGEGSNGKSVLLDVYKMMFPKQFVTSLTLQDLSSESVGVRSTILRSRLNISTEAKSNAVDAEEIKKIISGEQITVSQKFLEAVDFIPFTKLLVASNTRPYFNDTTHAIERRLVFITFKNRYVPMHELQKTQFPKQNRVHLAADYDTLIATFAEEKNAILGAFAEKLKDKLQYGWNFIETANMLAAKEEYKESNDPVGTFIKNRYEPSNNEFAYMTVQEVLDEYREWHKKNVSESSSLKLSTNSIGRKITEAFRIEGFRKYAKETGQVMCYNIKPKNYANELGPVGSYLQPDTGVGKLVQETLSTDVPW